MSKYLVTGGSGFIGTNVISFLIMNGHEILNIDIQAPKKSEHNKFFVKIDLCDFTNLNIEILKFNPDFVIHLAARTDLEGISLDNYKVNIEGVSNLINVLCQLNNLKRVIFTSSMYVCKPGYSPISFDDYNPHTIYGESKVLTERIIKEKNPDYTWTIIRPTSIWGPHFGEPYYPFFKFVLTRKYFHLGNKACKKTYGYIDNLIYQLVAILKSSKHEVNGKTFYLGDYDPYDISEWANQIAGFKNIKIPKFPFIFFKIAAYFGDCLFFLGLKFPLTSFRLRNMTTNNILDLSEIESIAPNLPVNRFEATKNTIEWIENSNF
jgi:nucleoside-diphosphate-sugar epimerase